jgi:hypothetical protein
MMSRGVALYVKSQASARVEDLDSRAVVRVLATDGDVRVVKLYIWTRICTEYF